MGDFVGERLEQVDVAPGAFAHDDVMQFAVVQYGADVVIIDLLRDIDIDLCVDVNRLCAFTLVIKNADAGVQGDSGKYNFSGGHSGFQRGFWWNCITQPGVTGLETACCKEPLCCRLCETTYNQSTIRERESYEPLRVSRSMSKWWDAIVVGAGPAGASCAVWLKQLGMSVLLLESQSEPGGLLRTNSYLDVWTVTSPDQTGQDMARHLARQIQIAGVEIRCLTKVLKVERAVCDEKGVSGFCVTLGPALYDGSGADSLPARECVPQAAYAEYARHVVIASGVRARSPAGITDEPPAGVLVGPGQQVMQYPFQGLSVAVLGGGDNAFENYLYARDQGARKVKLFARTVRAQQQFVNQVPAGDVVAGDIVLDPQARTVNGESFDCVLVFYGWEPCADFIDAVPVRRNSRGFIHVNPDTTETSVPGLYAIGEVTQRMHPCVSTAMADGVVAAKAIERRSSTVR